MEKSKKGGGAQPLSDETFEILQQKRCKPSKALDEVLLKKKTPKKYLLLSMTAWTQKW